MEGLTDFLGIKRLLEYLAELGFETTQRAFHTPGCLRAILRPPVSQEPASPTVKPTILVGCPTILICSEGPESQICSAGVSEFQGKMGQKP